MGGRGEELGRAFRERLLALMLSNSYRSLREEGVGHGEEGTAKCRALAFF